ncbi:hypothetical protein H5200_02505 [Pseudoalteromonas sp. SG43-7]|uniref:hypothetical protein n=1 Tax=Pseudoalteromonas sp. SG43-7 TaxID=2760966 RepID=UPI0016012975|nr:hypothetical protein [Pseudoalteromonas sp. SG43-7]MBB1420789.1 hypothetical protein [Pseudoalteromonas sp. SG43-7]
MRIYYSLTTLDPVIVSQSTATTNNHECLDYIPGSAILGALAARLYTQLDDTTSWQIFHSGGVKFGPCYPTIDQQQALPIPASWHFPKGQDPSKDQALNQVQIYNQASPHFVRQDQVQYKQCRDGYINAHTKKANIKQGMTVKTAIERQTGIAKESSLFSFAYLDAKQTFIGWIESDNPQQLAVIREQLKGQFTIGRSRNTEFGRVMINIIDQPSQSQPEVHIETLTIWCLSDCQCFNQQGLVTLTPDLTDLISTAQGTLNAQKSFIRSHRVRRFNQKRQGLDSEQLLIAKGSVLVYKLNKPLTVEQLSALQQQGMGINQQQGLGWISVNPTWANQQQLQQDAIFKAVTLPNTQVENFNDEPTSVLTKWLAERYSQTQIEDNVQNTVQSLIAEIGLAYHNARHYNYIIDHYQAGPSVNQWRRISNQLRQANQDWKNTLFEGDHCICKANNDQLGWGIRWHNGKKMVDFAEFFKLLLEENLTKNETDKQKADIVLALVNRISRYDLSTLLGLKKAAKELNFRLEREFTHHQETEK